MKKGSKRKKEKEEKKIDFEISKEKFLKKG